MLLLIHGAIANDTDTTSFLTRLNQIKDEAPAIFNSIATALSIFLPPNPSVRAILNFAPNEEQQTEIARITGHIDRLTNFLTRAGYNEELARAEATRAIAGVFVFFVNLDELGVANLRSDEEAKDYYANVGLPKANELALLSDLSNVFNNLLSLPISARTNTIQYFSEASLIARVSLAITLLEYKGKEDESAILTVLRAARNYRSVRERQVGGTSEESKAVEASLADDSKSSVEMEKEKPLSSDLQKAPDRKLRAKAAEKRRETELEEVKTSGQPAYSTSPYAVKQLSTPKQNEIG